MEKHIRNTLSIVFVIILIFSNVPTQVQAKSKVRLNKTSVTIYAGKTMTLKVSGTRKKVKWSSSNKKIATVNRKGKVTARKKGTATITAKVGKKTYKCKVTVKKPYSNVAQKSKNTCQITVESNMVCSHEWKTATCMEPQTCSKCGKTEGAANGHQYQWIVTKEASAGVAGQKESVCKVCGAVGAVETIPALAAVSKETAWIYSSNGTHREKTMYDGTLLQEEKIEYYGKSLWGWFDDEAASAMNAAIQTALQQVDGWQTFAINASYEEDAKKSAFVYAVSGGCSQGYHSNHGGLPNVNDNKYHITLVDGGGQDNYIACFVRDTYQESDDFTYGKYWSAYFGTYYASGNF